MYQGPMTRAVLLSAGVPQLLTFGPFDRDDELVSVVLTCHSNGASLVIMSYEIERRPGSEAPATPGAFGGGNRVTGGVASMVCPVDFDGVVDIPVNALFRQRELVLIRLTVLTGADQVHGLSAIRFRGPASRRAAGSVVSGGNGSSHGSS